MLLLLCYVLQRSRRRSFPSRAFSLLPARPRENKSGDQTGCAVKVCVVVYKSNTNGGDHIKLNARLPPPTCTSYWYRGILVNPRSGRPTTTLSGIAFSPVFFPPNFAARTRTATGQSNVRAPSIKNKTRALYRTTTAVSVREPQNETNSERANDDDDATWSGIAFSPGFFYAARARGVYTYAAAHCFPVVCDQSAGRPASQSVHARRTVRTRVCTYISSVSVRVVVSRGRRDVPSDHGITTAFIAQHSTLRSNMVFFGKNKSDRRQLLASMDQISLHKIHHDNGIYTLYPEANRPLYFYSSHDCFI